MTTHENGARNLSKDESLTILKSAIGQALPATGYPPRPSFKIKTFGKTVTVEWMDGPTEDQVRDVIRNFANTEFETTENGDIESVDLTFIYEGERVRSHFFGFNIERNYSREFLASMRLHTLSLLGKQDLIDDIQLVEKQWGCFVASEKHPVIARGIMDKAAKTSATDQETNKDRETKDDSMSKSPKIKKPTLAVANRLRDDAKKMAPELKRLAEQSDARSVNQEKEKTVVFAALIAISNRITNEKADYKLPEILWPANTKTAVSGLVRNHLPQTLIKQGITQEKFQEMRKALKWLLVDEIQQGDDNKVAQMSEGQAQQTEDNDDGSVNKKNMTAKIDTVLDAYRGRSQYYKGWVLSGATFAHYHAITPYKKDGIKWIRSLKAWVWPLDKFQTLPPEILKYTVIEDEDQEGGIEDAKDVIEEIEWVEDDRGAADEQAEDDRGAADEQAEDDEDQTPLTHAERIIALEREIAQLHIKMMQKKTELMQLKTKGKNTNGTNSNGANGAHHNVHTERTASTHGD